MLLNTKNLFFKSDSESESENSFLPQKLTNNFQHSRLSAEWMMEDRFQPLLIPTQSSN